MKYIWLTVLFVICSAASAHAQAQNWPLPSCDPISRAAGIADGTPCANPPHVCDRAGAAAVYPLKGTEVHWCSPLQDILGFNVYIRLHGTIGTPIEYNAGLPVVSQSTQSQIWELHFLLPSMPDGTYDVWITAYDGARESPYSPVVLWQIGPPPAPAQPWIR